MNESAVQPSLAGRVAAAVGATLLALVMTATSVIAVVWALATLLGLPDVVLWGLLVLGAVPVLWTTIWTAGRAWHAEKILEADQDIDQPDFKLGGYLGR